MSTQKLGANAKFRMGPDAANRVDMTQKGAGTTAFPLTHTRSARRIPGLRGRGASMRSKFSTYSFALTADSNGTNDSVLRAAWGSRQHVQYRQEGDGAGRPNSEVEAVVGQLTLTLNQSDDSCMWTAALPCDGKPTETDQ